ncbi:MAG: 2-oxo acid dehydrogenase subunit E2 [Anaerolineae bacterium]|nr:2-oxo acid dehydrogenase subunit E2 [Anaerolineae bacterium]
MTTQITLPEMGEGVIEGTLARWLVREGDRVERYAPIAEVETDKVTTETTTETAGTILRLCVGEGDTVPVGTVLAVIGEPGETTDDGRPPTAARDESSRPMTDDERPTTADGRPPNDTPLAAVGGRPSAVNAPYTGRISPVVGRIAVEHDVDLGQVTGTGRDGRITKDDILAYVAGMTADDRPPTAAGEATTDSRPLTAASEATTDGRPLTAASGANRLTTNDSSPSDGSALAAVGGRPSAVGDELLPLTSIRRAIAEHMVRSKHTSPHVTTVFEFDFAAVAAHRRAHKAAFERDGVRLTYMAYIVAATVAALKQHPLANSSWTDDGILLHRAVNIGMATAIADGLIVPVIKGADGLNLLGLARAVNDLADRARAKQLKPDEVRGGTFSITNHGTSGSLFATPIINQPQCGILGVGAIEKRVKVIDDAIAIRPLAYVSFTFDHRILDGASADGFVSAIKNVIENYQ